MSRIVYGIVSLATFVGLLAAVQSPQVSSQLLLTLGTGHVMVTGYFVVASE